MILNLSSLLYLGRVLNKLGTEPGQKGKQQHLMISNNLKLIKTNNLYLVDYLAEFCILKQDIRLQRPKIYY